MIPAKKVKAALESMSAKTAMRIEDISCFYGEAFEGTRQDQREIVTRLLLEAIAKQAP
jgi:hypothetical protein